MANMKNREVDVGDVLVADYKGRHFSLEVVKHPEEKGMVAFQMTTPRGFKFEKTKGVVTEKPLVFKTVSGAAESITYPKQRNGWEFWKPEGEEDETIATVKTVAKKTLAKPEKATSPKAKAATPTKKAAKAKKEPEPEPEDEDEELEDEDEELEDELEFDENEEDFEDDDEE